MTLEQVQSDYKCYNCQKLCIRGDPSLIRAVGNLYHKQCFKCNSCQVSVIDKFFILDDTSSVILCEKDYYQLCSFKCHQCNQSITKSNYEVIGDYKYHRHCLHCPGCTIVKNLPPSVCTIIAEEEDQEESFERYDYNGRPYCRYHYSLIKGTECVGCRQTVLHQYMDLAKSDEKWHPECYMIMKYWHVELIDLQPTLQSDYKSKQQLVLIQNDVEYIRCSIWKEFSSFEDTTSKIISNIILLHQSSDYKQEYESCLLLTSQMNIIFSVLDLVFKYFTHLSCDVPTQKLSDQLVLFLDNLCQTNLQHIGSLTKLASLLSQYTRDLVKLSLQQTIILKRQDNDLIDQVLSIYSTKSSNQPTSLPYLNHNLRLIDLAMSKLAFVLNIKPQEGKQPDETIVYKPTMIRPTLFPIQQQKRLVNSSTNIHQLTQQNSDSLDNLKRSNSSSKKQPDLMTKNTSRIDTIRRALTTSRTKKDSSILSRSNSIFSSRRDQKSYSLHNPSTPPLYISLPDVEQLHTTPPLSPPSSNQQIWTIPTYLPDLTQQQDCIVRHIAVLYAESHVANDCILLDDLLALLENNKKSSSAASLWGKLKTHILTPNENNLASTQQQQQQQQQQVYNNEKKIGVSLSNISNGSLTNHRKTVEIHNFEYWKTQCPSVDSCFSSNSFAPGFIKDCILAMIDQDVNTEGIFRKNGNIRVLKEMCEQLDDAQQQRNDWLDFFRDQHIIQLAAFVKRYLRELPEPLLTARLHKLFLMSNDKADNITIIHYAICLLPKVNRDILLLVLSLLNWVAKHSSENKMDFENLARVMAPNILYNHKKQSPSSCADVSLCHGEIRVVATMIEYYDTFIKVPNDFTVLLENPKMAEYLCNNSIDLTCSKHFLKTYNGLLKLKKDILSSKPVLPPSPSTSTL